MAEQRTFDPKMKFPLGGMQYEKMREYSIWYSGEPDLLANYYILYNTHNIFNTSYQVNRKCFWARQDRENTTTSVVHIPMASDIAELSSDLLFGETPTVKLTEAFKKDASEQMKLSQSELEDLLTYSGFDQKLAEGAETQAAIGGVYIKLAISHEMSDYPLIVVEQPDNAIPTFKHGKLYEVTFVNTVRIENSSMQGSTKDVWFRLLETYTMKGEILYNLYVGDSIYLGNLIDVNFLSETEDIEDIETGYDGILTQYVPNMLPNRLDRDSSLGRSDLQGLESLMHSLDETYSAWMRDIAVAKAKLLVPSSFLESVVGDNSIKEVRFDAERAIYEKMNVDPMNKNFKIEAVQFAIRAEEFERTCLNLMERIASGAGYSPQSFGLNIAGRVESGEALNIREKKSFSKKTKKQKFWKLPLVEIVQSLVFLYNEEFSGSIEGSEINVEFGDGITNDINETSKAVKTIREAKAASTETLIKMIHPDWTDEQVKDEVEAIINDEKRMVEDPGMEEEYLKFKESLNNGTDTKTKTDNTETV